MKPTRILVADDHPIVLEGLQSFLAAHGPEWEVCAVAANGFDAVAKAVALIPDIVIMDDRMPLLNGLEAAAEIKRRAPGVEVLLFCEAESPAILQKIFHSSARGGLLKSEALDTLVQALEMMRRHHRIRSRAITDHCEAAGELSAAPVTLTPRETEVLRLSAQELSTKEIASQLGVSNRTVETHRTKLFRKLKARSVVGLVRYAIQQGLVEV